MEFDPAVKISLLDEKRHADGDGVGFIVGRVCLLADVKFELLGDGRLFRVAIASDDQLDAGRGDIEELLTAVLPQDHVADTSHAQEAVSVHKSPHDRFFAEIEIDGNRREKCGEAVMQVAERLSEGN